MKKQLKELWQISKEKDQAAKEIVRAYRSPAGLWFLCLFTFFITSMSGMVFAVLAAKAPDNFEIQTTVYRNAELHRQVYRKDRSDKLVVDLSIYHHGRFIQNYTCDAADDMLCNPNAAEFDKYDSETILPASRVEQQKWYRTRTISRIDYLLENQPHTFTAAPINPRSELAFYQNLADFCLTLAAGLGALWLLLSVVWWQLEKRRN